MGKSDIVIIGGGVMGSSIAYNLLNDGYTGTITIFEKDPTYQYASTPRSAGGIRQLFVLSNDVFLGAVGYYIYFIIYIETVGLWRYVHCRGTDTK